MLVGSTSYPIARLLLRLTLCFVQVGKCREAVVVPRFSCSVVAAGGLGRMVFRPRGTVLSDLRRPK